MNGFLPCCPFDCQTLMDSEILIDDFLQMEKDFLDVENEMNLSTEVTSSEGQKISDYDLINLPSAEYTKSVSDVTCDNAKQFDLEETLEKSILTLSTSPLTNLEDKNNENMIITNSEAPSEFSSVSKAFQIAIFEGSDNIEAFHNSSNIESFQDLNALLNKEYYSVPACNTEEILNVDPTDNILEITNSTQGNPIKNSITKRHPSGSESTTSSSLLDENFDYEPQNKIAKVTDCASTSKDKKYYEMRRKNNISSRRSRQTKKQREKELEEKEKQLIKENESLRKREKELELLVQKVKDILFSSVKKKT